MTLPRVSVAAAARTARAPTAEPEGNDTGSARRTLYCGGNSRRRRRAVADRGALLVDGEERRLADALPQGDAVGGERVRLVGIGGQHQPLAAAAAPNAAAMRLPSA